MKKSKKILCIVAGQRAGTTALHSALATSGHFENFGEIFHTENLRNPGAFLNFAKSQDLKVSEMATDLGVRKVTSEYLDFLEDLAKDKFPLIDIKLNSWNALRSFWNYPTQEPSIMSHLRERGACFIFVSRADLSAQILSEYIARATGKWHNLSANEMQQSITVPLKKAAAQARLILETEKLLYQYIGSSVQTFPTWYENLYVDGAVNSDLQAWLGQQFGIRFSHPLRPSIKKNAVSKKAKITNYAEIKSAINDLCLEVGRVSIPQLPQT